MADNVDLPASSVKAAADEVTYSGDTTKIQLVKPVIVTGTEGSKAITDIAFTSAGEQRIMAHRDAICITSSVSGHTTATTSYVGGDQVGTMITFANAARANGGSGMITGVTFVQTSNLIGAYDLVLFRSSVTLGGDNTAFSITTAADIHEVIYIVQLSGAWSLGTPRLAQAHNLAIPYTCGGSTTSIYGALITRLGHSYFSGSDTLKVNLYIERN